MGQRYLFVCSPCKYEAEVSGGPDRGMVIGTVTMYCGTCRELCDVPSRFFQDHMLSESFDEKGFEDIVDRCPKCGGRELAKWMASDPCPRCGGAMERGGPGTLWD